MTHLAIYLWTMVDKLVVISMVGMAATLFGTMVCITEDQSAYAVRFAKGLIGFVIAFALIPSKSDLALIYVVPKLAESKVIQQDVPEIYDLAIKALKETLNAHHD